MQTVNHICVKLNTLRMYMYEFFIQCAYFGSFVLFSLLPPMFTCYEIHYRRYAPSIRSLVEHIAVCACASVHVNVVNPLLIAVCTYVCSGVYSLWVISNARSHSSCMYYILIYSIRIWCRNIFSMPTPNTNDCNATFTSLSFCSSTQNYGCLFVSVVCHTPSASFSNNRCHILCECFSFFYSLCVLSLCMEFIDFFAQFSV